MSIYLGFGSSGQWYVQVFSDLTLYWIASGSRLKNGNAAGVTVTVIGTRARPKAKAESVARVYEAAWKPVASSDVPAAVIAAHTAYERR